MRNGDPDLIFLQEAGDLGADSDRFIWTDQKSENYNFWKRDKGPVKRALTHKAGKLKVSERTRSTAYRVLFQQWGVDGFRCSLAILIHEKHGDIGLANMVRIFQGPEEHHIDPGDKKSSKAMYESKMRPLLGITLGDATYFSYHAPSAYNAAKITADYISKLRAKGISKWVMIGDFNCIPSENYGGQTDSANYGEDESDDKAKKPRQNLVGRLVRDLAAKNEVRTVDKGKTTQIARLDWVSKKLFASSNLFYTHYYLNKPGSTLDYMVSDHFAGVAESGSRVQIDESDHGKQVFTISDGKEFFDDRKDKSKPPLAPGAPKATGFKATKPGVPALNVAAVPALASTSGNRRQSLGKRSSVDEAGSPRSRRVRKSSKTKN